MDYILVLTDERMKEIAKRTTRKARRINKKNKKELELGVTYTITDHSGYSPVVTHVGKESAGIPEEILVENEEDCIRIPMGHDIRSLNLSNSVAIVLYEALRQNDFAGLEETGELHRLKWN